VLENHTTKEHRHGSSMEILTGNGNCLLQSLIYGFMENVRVRVFYPSILLRRNLRVLSRCREEHFLVRYFFGILSQGLMDLTSSTIIEDIDHMRKSGLASLAFFYCDFRDDDKKNIRGLLSSLLMQFCHSSDCYSAILSDFYSKHDNGSRHPSDNALVGCLKRILEYPGQAPAYIIIDALDESQPKTTRISKN
jgi:hypothetical protein